MVRIWSPRACLALAALLSGCGSEAAPEGAGAVRVTAGAEVFLLNGERERFAVDGRTGLDFSNEARPRIDLNECGTLTLRSLALEVGSELRFPDVLPYAGRLVFHVGFEEPAVGATASAPYRLTVLAADATGERELWSAERRPPLAESERRWVEHSLDLAGTPGRDLVLVVDGPSGTSATAPVWGNPRLVGGAREVLRGPARGPSAVVFLVDTLRADRLGTYGYPAPTSPAFDALGEEGLVFERAYASSPWTKPSVASLFTSRPPSRHGVHDFSHRLGESETTLAQVASAHGVRTAALGTNHWVFGEEFNLGTGFRHFLRVVDVQAEQGPAASADQVVDETIDWLERFGDEPFLLYVHVTDPHEPYVPNPGFEHWVPEPPERPLHGDRFGPAAFNRLTSETATEQDLAYLRGLYDAEVAFVDAQFARLVRALQRLERWQETAVVVVADHGEEFLDHGGWGHASTLLDEQVRVPLILRAPASRGVQPRRVRRTVSIEDVAPTVLELLGIEPPSAFEGRSLLSSEPRGPVLSELHLPEVRSIAVVERDLKLIQQLVPDEGERAFRLSEDPGERTNVLGELDPERLAQLRERVRRARADAVPDGWYVEVFGAGAGLKIQGLLRSDHPITDLNVMEGERLEVGRAMTGDQAFYPTEDKRVAAFEIELGDGDVRDLVRFSVPAGAQVGLGLNPVVGDLPPVFLGAEADRDPRPAPVNLPVRLGADDPRLATSRLPPREGRDGPQVRLLRLERDRARIDDAASEHLRALGYDAGE